MKNRIIIIGAGGHGKVVLDTILAQNIYEVIGFADDGLELGVKVEENYKIIANSNDVQKLKLIADSFVVAIGNNTIREKIFNKLNTFLEAAIVVHPKASIAVNVVLNSGTVVLANAVVSANCIVGENTVINAGVIVDHECKIGSNVHLSIGTIVGCNSVVPDCYKTNLGEVIQPFSEVK